MADSTENVVLPTKANSAKDTVHHTGSPGEGTGTVTGSPSDVCDHGPCSVSPTEITAALTVVFSVTSTILGV